MTAATRRTGMTLLETLLALALLACVAAAVAGWTGAVARLGAEAGPRVGAERAVMAALRLLEDDLRCGDLGPAAASRQGARAARERVEVADDGSVSVRTRDAGPLVRTWTFDADARTLSVRESRGGKGSDAATSVRTLARGVDAWEVSFDPTASRTLTVSWRAAGREGTWKGAVP